MSDNKIIKVNIDDEMKSAYIDYSMSVIVSRALPDVRDGFKPVHRRVLFGMMELGVYSNRPYKKSARIVGEVLGKYHPHGDSSVYDTMVRMAQEWSLRYMLVDGQGNFGSIDGDSPAAMRYTEARLQKIAEETIDDIEKETVDFTLNFDDSLEEPTVLPAKFPQLLVNGASGIAVGMATNMAPHNLSEVIDGIIAYINNNEIENYELLHYIKAPDFPTGGIIYGYDGVKDAYATGRGRIVMRAKAEIIEQKGGREVIIVTEIPYQVNKAEMIAKTAKLVNEGKISGISDIRDESDRNGMRIVYELKRDAIPNVVLNRLFKNTSLQSTFSINNICLVNGRPELLNLKQLITHFVDFRHEVVVRRTKFDLRKAQERAHILEGLIIASDHIDEVIALIRQSQSPDEARQKLIDKFQLSEIQARAIVEMRLRQLTGLEQDKLRNEYSDLQEKIKDFEDILANVERRMNIITTELSEIKDKFGDKRRSVIEYSADQIEIEDLIPNHNMLVSISNEGYIKRTDLSEYRTQSRGGIGSTGTSTRDKDFVKEVFSANNHDYLMIFTKKGLCFWMRVFDIPEGSKTSKGKPIQNLINISQDDKVITYMNVNNLKEEDFLLNNYVLMCTKNGTIKKSLLKNYSNIRSNGIIAISIREDDELLDVQLTDGSNQIIVATNHGKAIRFDEKDIREVGRTSIGVKGLTLSSKDDIVIGMVVVKNENDELLVISENGYGKRSLVDGYRKTKRGGKGVKAMNITDKTGNLINIKTITNDNNLIIIKESGVVIRLNAGDIRTLNRATQGVKLVNLRKGDKIASAAIVKKEDQEEE